MQKCSGGGSGVCGFMRIHDDAIGCAGKLIEEAVLKVEIVREDKKLKVELKKEEKVEWKAETKAVNELKEVKK